MVQAAPRRRGSGGCGHASWRAASLGRALSSRVATPIIAHASARPGYSCCVSASATLGSLALFCTKRVTVKLLPFDNKSELQVVVDLPEGASVEDTERALQAIGRSPARGAGGRLVPDLCGHGRAVQFQRPGAPLLPARRRRSWASRRSIWRRKATASAPATTSRSTLRQRSKSCRAAGRHRAQGGRAAAGTAGAGDAAGRDLRPGSGDPPRRGRRRCERRFARVPFIVDVDDCYRPAAPDGCASPSTRTSSNIFGVEQRDVYDTIAHAARRRDGRLFPPRRGPPADRDPPSSCPKARPRAGRALASTTPVPANALPGSARVVELGEVVSVTDEPASLPDLPPQRPLRRDGDGRTRRRLRGADLRHARRRERDRRARLGRPAEARDRAARPARRTKRSPTLLWDGEWEVTWVTFRDMGARLHGRASSASTSWSSRSSASSSCRWSS